MTNTTQEQQTLTLRKCAYIFDDSHSLYTYGTKAQIERKNKIQKFMREFYDNTEKLKTQIPYIYTEDDNGGENFYITVDGHLHRLNALQIARLNDKPGHVINHRRHVPTLTVEGYETRNYQTNFVLYNKKYRSLYFEFFTGADNLGYIRAHFKRNTEKFIIDDRTGKIYSPGEHGCHRAQTSRTIAERLEIESQTAQKEFYNVIDKITQEPTTPENIHAKAVASLPAKDIDHHANDLYLRVTPEATKLVDELTNKSLLATFTDNIDGVLWYELPFCYNPQEDGNNDK